MLEKIDIEKYRINIEIIKLSISTLGYVGLSIKQCLEKIIYYLFDYYETDKNKKCLLCIVLHIQVYLEMGYDYDDNRECFDAVLQNLGTDRKTIFPKRFYQSTKIKLNKSQVRSMIGKWNASNSMTISEVVDDIINKVKQHKEGIYYYKNNRGGKIETKDAISGELYELVINGKDCYFHDIKRRKYFTFI